MLCSGLAEDSVILRYNFAQWVIWCKRFGGMYCPKVLDETSGPVPRCPSVICHKIRSLQIIAVCCENSMKHMSVLCWHRFLWEFYETHECTLLAQFVVRILWNTWVYSVDTVCCENSMKHMSVLCWHSLLWEFYETHECTMWHSLLWEFYETHECTLLAQFVVRILWNTWVYSVGTVCCENSMKHMNVLCWHSLLWEFYETHECTLLAQFVVRIQWNTWVYSVGTVLEHCLDVDLPVSLKELIKRARDRTIWCGDNGTDLHPGDAWFESLLVIGCPGFLCSQSCQANYGVVLRLGHDRFHLSLFQFIILWPSYL
jgi:hypothetical protein